MTTDKRVIRASSLMGGGDCGAPTLVDVRDGVITRIRPLHYDMSYDPKDFNAWRLEVNGKTLAPPLRPPIGPVSLAYKKRVYSKNRVRYPLRRVDGDDLADGAVRLREVVAAELHEAQEGFGPVGDAGVMLGIRRSEKRGGFLGILLVERRLVESNDDVARRTCGVGHGGSLLSHSVPSVQSNVR